MNFTIDSIKKIEVITRKQSESPTWFQFRKGTITASKSYEVKTKMEKLIKCGGGGYVIL